MGEEESERGKKQCVCVGFGLGSRVYMACLLWRCTAVVLLFLFLFFCLCAGLAYVPFLFSLSLCCFLSYSVPYVLSFSSSPPPPFLLLFARPLTDSFST